MTRQLNLCTSILPNHTLELQVHDEYHCGLNALEAGGLALRRVLRTRGLDIAVLNTNVGIDDDATVERLLTCAQKIGARQIRLPLPRRASSRTARGETAAVGAVGDDSKEEGSAGPGGVALGTIMSSFSST